VFFALTPPPAVQIELADAQERLAAVARRVPPENFHLTLAFLGEQPDDRVALARDLVNGLELPPLTLRLCRPGWFSGAGVGWLGPLNSPAPLLCFQAALSERLRRAGFKLDGRPWEPHVTLYRGLRKPLGNITLEAIVWPVRSFVLMRSESIESGVRYAAIDCWPTTPPDDPPDSA
jgi:2'-5' RNA ligase